MCAFKPSKTTFFITSHDMGPKIWAVSKGKTKRFYEKILKRKKVQEHWAKMYLYYAIKLWTKIRYLLPVRQYSKQFSRNSFPSYYFFTKKKHIFYASSLNFTLYVLFFPCLLLFLFFIFLSLSLASRFLTLHRTHLILESLKSSKFFRNCILFAHFVSLALNLC